MSEPQARAGGPRGRGSGRGGRGGYSSRGGRPRQANGDKTDHTTTAEVQDEGELGQLKKQYSSKLSTIKEMFPDWTDEDIVFALQETDGDLEGTIDRISEGNVSQWGEVKKRNPKDRARPKAKDAATDGFEGATHVRGGRGRGDGTRGGRGRGTERGRGATRGRGGGPAATKKQASTETADAIPATEPTSAWDAPKDSTATADTTQPGKSDEDTDAASWEMVTPAEAAPPPAAADSQKSGSKPDGTRSWASMLRPSPKPKSAPVKAKTPPTAVPKAAAVAETPEIPAIESQAPEPPADIVEPPPDGTAGDIPATPKSPSVAPSEAAAHLTPSKDELTETNLEQVADSSTPVATETVASNAGTTDARVISSSLPLVATPQQPSTARPGLGGFATTALKATSGTGRSSSFQRRVKEQQEAVVMPGNHAVDRTAVQFGSMGLGGSEELDPDDEREEPETRAQPPQHSPVAPRAALPPAAQQAAETTTTTRPAPGLPSVPQPAQADTTQSQQPQAQGNFNYSQFNSAYGTPSSQGEHAAPATKPYEPFGQQAQQASSHQYDGFPSQSQATGQPSHLAHHQGAYSSAGSEYPSYYTSDSQRNAYGQYYGGYGQHAQSGPHDTASTHRAAGAFGTSGPEQPSVSALSQGQQGSASRLGASADSQPSGHSTPNPPLGQQHGQQQSHHMGHAGAGGHGFPYGSHPSYYNNPYYASQYMNQVSHQPYHGRHRPPFDDVRRFDDQVLTQNDQYGYGAQGGYGSGPYGGGGAGGGGKYGQPHQGYGMSPQSSYNAHSASPAGDFGQQPGSLPGRDSSSGLGAYGRAGSTQPSESQTHTSGAFAGMSDVFNRSQSSYTQQSQHSGNQQSGNEESRYGESSKIPGGPSPAPGQVGRPGSAANVQGGQGGLGGSASQSQQGYSGYPSHMGQHGQQNQYSGGLGGLSSHQQGGGQSHQNSQYGGYGGGFGGSYYGSNNRGGWTGGNFGGGH